MLDQKNIETKNDKQRIVTSKIIGNKSSEWFDHSLWYFLDTEQKVDLVLKEVLDGKIITNDDVVLKFLEIDCGYDVRVKEN